MALMSREEILELADRIDRQKSSVDGEQEGLKALYASVLGFEMRPDAFKAAHKLTKLKPIVLQAWLHTFDAVREALDLDAQLALDMVLYEPEATATETVPTGAGKEKPGNGHKPSVTKGDARAALAAAKEHLGTDELPPAV